MIGFIGMGNMGSAICGRALEANLLKKDEVTFFDASPERMKEVQIRYGIEPALSNADLVQKSEIVILAVKPQYFSSVAAEICTFTIGKSILSIIAGCTMDQLRAAFGEDSHLMRVMPNTPAMIGRGYTALCTENSFSEHHLQWTKKLFSLLGKVQFYPERLFDAITATSGSGPAYGYMLAEAMADGAVKLGLSRKDAITAAAQTLLGAAAMIIETGEHPASLKDKVCSPAGTTIEAVYCLEKAGFRGAVMEAMEACAEKCRHL